MKNCLLFIVLLGLTYAAKAQKPISLPTVPVPVFRKDTLSIVQNKAFGDGLFLNTIPINDAINTIHKKGGGVVLIPSGLWLTGPIVLKSNVNLHLQTGATLLFTADFSQYKLEESNWEGLAQMRNQSPISAVKATNIAITGNGIIDGNGDAWRMVKKDKLNESQWKKLLATGGILSDDRKTWYPSEKSFRGSKLQNPGVIEAGKSPEFYEGVKDFLRPNMVVFSGCKGVMLEGVTFQNSPAWCLHPLMSEDIVVRGITVKNPWYGQNGDGIDVESCKNVLIENSVFDVGDDALCMKSGRDAAGRKRAMPTENVTIRGCTVYASHGGFVIGSEMSGGVRNISVTNCSFIGSDIGLRFKTARGRGGVVENIFIDGIYMKNIPAEAILFDMYYMAKDPVPLEGEKREMPKVEQRQVDESTPIFRNFHIRNVYCSGAETGIFVRGLPEMHVKDVVLENMVLQAKKGMDIQEASGIVFKNITILSKETDPVIDIIQSDNLLFDNIRFTSSPACVFRISGDKNAGITVQNTEMNSAKQKIKFELGAKQSMIKVQ